MKLTLSTTIKGIAVDLQITGDNGTVATALLARVIEAARMEEELPDDEGDEACDDVLGRRNRGLRSDEPGVLGRQEVVVRTCEHSANGAEADTGAFGVALGGVIAEGEHYALSATAPINRWNEKHRFNAAQTALNEEADSLLLFLHAVGEPIRYVANEKFVSAILQRQHSSEALPRLVAADAVYLRGAPEQRYVCLTPWGTDRALALAADATRMAAALGAQNGTTHS